MLVTKYVLTKLRQLRHDYNIVDITDCKICRYCGY